MDMFCLIINQIIIGNEKYLTSTNTFINDIQKRRNLFQ